MTALKKSYYIKSRDFIRAGEASIKIQTLLTKFRRFSNPSTLIHSWYAG